MRGDPVVPARSGERVRPGLFEQLLDQIRSAPVPQPPRAQIVEIEAEALQVEPDSFAVIRYESEEPCDSPNGIAIAFANSLNTARCSRRRSIAPISG